MKKSKILALVLVVLMLVSTLTSCELLDKIMGFIKPPVECTEHVDVNKDGKCDNCGTTVAPPTCTDHVDTNPVDLKCDNCGRTLPCPAHVDTNPADAKCDLCGAAMDCPGHVDTNPADAKCDICGTVVECPGHVDDNIDFKCDFCGARVMCDHKDTDGDLKCDRCGDKVRDPNAEYTYNTYLSTFPTNWNNHTYETATDSEIIGYTELGFYTFDYNEDMDGFAVVPEMAAEMPIDVSSSYAGEEWGIADGETSRAWLITLRDDLKWEDGTAITAHDFVTSAQLLLNPEANNHRADSLYSGELVLVGAKDYFYSGKTVLLDSTQVYSEYSTDIDSKLIFNIGPKHAGATGVSYFRNWLEVSCGAPSTYPVDSTASFFIANFLAEGSAFTPEVAEKMEGKTFAEIKADPEMSAAWNDLIKAWQTDPNEELHFFVAEDSYPVTAWDSVGIKALDDNSLVLILDSALEGFYLHYNLTGSWLVHEETYTDCMEEKDGVYYNSYGTSAEKYKSYGPYKLESFQMDKQFVLVKNNEWYGYSDEANANTYWTTKIVYDWIENPETAMQAFLQGNLDAKGLDVDQMAEFGTSKHLYYTDGSSTFFVAMNPDESAFAKWEESNPGKDKSILGVKEFRMALSFSLDRQSFNLACDPTGSSAFAVFNNMIISDPENGTPYRTTEYAKDVILDFWGITPEDVELFYDGDKDAAIRSITGYNLEAAKELFDQAYDIAIAEGLMEATDVVEICIGIPSPQAKFYTNGYNFLVNNYTEAVKGTKLEGKLTFTKDDTIGNAFSDALKSNQVNLLFGVGWTGSALNPYNLMMAYTTPDYQYDVSAWNTAVETMDFEIDGVTYRASVEAWTYAMMGDEINISPVNEDGTLGEAVAYSCGLNDGKPDERLRLFAALEGAVLRTYDLLPLNNESSAALKGMQIKYYTEDYVYGIGRGGIKYMTYNYNDAEWAAYVASQGGTLNYK